MALDKERLDLRFRSFPLALSARRLWEHTVLRQVNPFLPIIPGHVLHPDAFIDIVDVSGRTSVLTGLTLADTRSGAHGALSPSLVPALLQRAATPRTRTWLLEVKDHLVEASGKRALRNMPAPFLPLDGAAPFGVRGLHSALLQWLVAHGDEQAAPSQWLARINNLSRRGLRSEELAFGRFEANARDTSTARVNGIQLASCLDLRALRLSIVPVTRESHTQIHFTKVTRGAHIKRIKPKLKRPLVSQPEWRDRVLGYSIDRVDWEDLLGSVSGWMAFTHRGEALTSKAATTGMFAKEKEAKILAMRHARRVYPKLSTRGYWSRYRISGGADYREWLVTLPYYPESFFSGHFEHRNVLMHVRCDVREGENGARILLLQEVQSDWAQEARRMVRDRMPGRLPVPPWLNEWPALALKLALLHAAYAGMDAVAWTTGQVQVQRYRGLGADGLVELYDRTLPTEAARLLRPFRRRCQPIEIYQPVNFRIEPANLGYDVLDAEGVRIGTAASIGEAHALLPDGAHEVLQPMHGIRLDQEFRAVLLERGFFAWGNGIC